MLRATFWKYGFFIHLSLVLLIAASAYFGILPTTYDVIPYSDLIGHAVLIGLLAFFLDGWLRFRPLIPGKVPFLRLAPMIILSIAAFEELAQSLSPRRTASLKDFAADVIGVCLCSWIARRISRLPESDRLRES